MQLEIKLNLFWLFQSDFLQSNVNESDKEDSSAYVIIQLLFVNLKEEESRRLLESDGESLFDKERKGIWLRLIKKI